MVTGRSQRFSVVISGSQWFPVILNSYELFSMCSIRWLSVVLNGSQCFTVDLKGSRWLSVVLNGFQ